MQHQTSGVTCISHVAPLLIYTQQLRRLSCLPRHAGQISISLCSNQLTETAGQSRCTALSWIVPVPDCPCPGLSLSRIVPVPNRPCPGSSLSWIVPVCFCNHNCPYATTQGKQPTRRKSCHDARKPKSLRRDKKETSEGKRGRLTSMMSAAWHHAFRH